MPPRKKPQALTRPVSETNIHVNFLGLGCFFAAMFGLPPLYAKLVAALEITSVPSVMDLTLLAACTMIAAVLPIAIYDLFFAKSYLNPTAGLGRKPKLKPTPMLCFYATYAIGIYAYALLEGQSGDAAPTFAYARHGVYALLALALFYAWMGDRKQGPAGYRVFVKLTGLYASYLLVAFGYWLFPEYGGFYDRAFLAAHYALYPLIIGAPLYFWYIDSRQEKPEGAYYQFGRLILSRERDKDTKRYLAELGRNWLVKGFFLPLMFIFLSNNVNFLSETHEHYPLSMAGFWDLGIGGWWDAVKAKTAAISPSEWGKGFFDYMNTLLYTVDVAFAATGYAMTYRALDAHIRSVEPTMFGWIICIICYPPFWNGLFYQNYFDYGGDFQWGSWLWNTPAAYLGWMTAILLCVACYSWATVAMGYRFSNLTYRGVITSGPYRFTKHPAYVFKNTSFWLVSVPFISNEPTGMVIRHCLLLFGVNLIYYFRARTEERHLLNYPEYRQYCEWMDEHSWFRFLKRVPCFDWRVSAGYDVKAWWRQENGGRA